MYQEAGKARQNTPISPSPLVEMRDILLRMQPQSRRIFTIAWTVGALIVLWCQIIAVGMPPVMTGSQRIILIGPAAVVLAVLPVNFLVMWLLTRRRSANDTTFRGNRLVRFIGVATTGLLGSLLTVFVLTISANLTINHVVPFLN